MRADLAINNGKVITIDEKFSIAEAVAEKDSKIIAVGTNNDVQPFIGEDTQVLDITGKTMLPGINEAHIHAAQFGGARPPVVINAGYPTVKSIGDIAEAVGRKVKDAQPDE
jgi:predicted amidohydrolase YtcJ